MIDYTWEELTPTYFRTTDHLFRIHYIGRVGMYGLSGPDGITRYYGGLSDLKKLVTVFHDAAKNFNNNERTSR